LKKMMQDKALGTLMLVVAVTVLTYYTAWTLVMPFVDVGHAAHDFFPPREYAIKLPAYLLLLGVTVVGTFTSLVMIRSGQKKRVARPSEPATTSVK